MDKSIIQHQTPIEPNIHIDGGYATCAICYCEVTPHDDICPRCGQLQDWNWFWEMK